METSHHYLTKFGLTIFEILWNTAETPFLQVPCTGAHDRNSGVSSFKTNRAHGNNCIKNVLAWLHIATSYPDANVAARNQAQRWQQQRWRVCHQKNWKWVQWVYFLNTFCCFGQTQLSSSGAFSGYVYTSKPKQVNLASYWKVKGARCGVSVDWFVLRKQGVALDLTQHSRIILVVNPEK